MRAKNIATILITAGLAAGLAGCQVGEAQASKVDEQPAITALPVDVVVPVEGSIFATYQSTATIDADVDAQVVARVDGELVDVLVEEGDAVAAGQLIARLDGDRLRLQMQQAAAQLERASKEHDRFQRLHKKGLVSASAVEGLEFDVAALRATYELKRLDYEYTHIRAPITGVVSLRAVKLGQQLNVNDLIFTISDTQKLVANLTIPQAEMFKFAVGNVTELQVDSLRGEVFTATIARISPTINTETGTFRATVYVDNSAAKLAPGMFARFDVAYEEHAEALIVPASAIVREDGQSTVFIVEQGTVVSRVIETGIESGQSVEVVEGLQGNEQVIVGLSNLRNGSKVVVNTVTAWSAAG